MCGGFRAIKRDKKETVYVSFLLAFINKYFGVLCGIFHNLFHILFGDSNTPHCIGSPFACTVKKDCRALEIGAFFVVIHCKSIIIPWVIAYQMLSTHPCAT